MTLVLLNPHARGGRAAELAQPVAQWLAREHPAAALQLSPDLERARVALQALPPASRVVVIGGDGSVHQALGELLAGRHELGLVPFGSGDDGARALGLHGWPWPRALAHALTARATAVDVGWLQTARERRPFLSSVNAGFDAAVARRALALPRWLRGMPRYLVATLHEVLWLRCRPLRVVADGATVHDGPALFVSALNTPTYGSGMPAAPMARLDDGRLDLLLAGRFGRLGTLAMLPRLLRGTHLGHPQVRCEPFARLELAAEAPFPVAADGEPLASTTHVQIDVAPAALRVVRAG